MDQHPSASPEQARKFAPKEQPREDPVDETGRALIAMLEHAASLANENYKGPTELANKIVRELRVARPHTFDRSADCCYGIRSRRGCRNRETSAGDLK